MALLKKILLETIYFLWKEVALKRRKQILSKAMSFEFYLLYDVMTELTKSLLVQEAWSTVTYAHYQCTLPGHCTLYLRGIQIMAYSFSVDRPLQQAASSQVSPIHLGLV